MSQAARAGVLDGIQEDGTWDTHSSPDKHSPPWHCQG